MPLSGVGQKALGWLLTVQLTATLRQHRVRLARAARAEGTKSPGRVPSARAGGRGTVGLQRALIPLPSALICSAGRHGGQPCCLSPWRGVRAQCGAEAVGDPPHVAQLRRALAGDGQPCPPGQSGQEAGHRGPPPGAVLSRPWVPRGVLSAGERGAAYVSSSFFMSLERNFSLKLARVTSPGYFRSSKLSSDTSWSSASEEAKEWAAGSDCKKPAGRRFNQLARGRAPDPGAEGEGPFQTCPQRHVLESPVCWMKEEALLPQTQGTAPRGWCAPSPQPWLPRCCPVWLLLTPSAASGTWAPSRAQGEQLPRGPGRPQQTGALRKSPWKGYDDETARGTKDDHNDRGDLGTVWPRGPSPA